MAKKLSVDNSVEEMGEFRISMERAATDSPRMLHSVIAGPVET